MNSTEYFIDELIKISKTSIDNDTIHQIKRCLIDYVGVTFAGSCLSYDKMKNYMASLSESGSCNVIGYGEKISIFGASFINGYNAHVIELDDGHRFGMLHLEATIITAMISVAQQEDLDLLSFYGGIIAGYEAAIRIARAIQPKHKQMGFHATGTCGAIGVACAIAAALKFDLDQWKCALSAAATGASGLLEVIDDGSELKPYNIANAVQTGIAAAYMGQARFLGPDDVLSGERGFFNAFSSGPKLSALGGDGKLAINEIYFKPYAACRHCHAPIECTLNIVKDNNVNFNEIVEVLVETYKLAVFGHDNTEVINTSSAKMSTPYSVAVAAITRDAGVYAYEKDKISDNRIRQLCKRVKVVENVDLTKASPAKRGALVTFKMKNGTILKDSVEYPLGEPEHAVDDSILVNKCKTLLKYAGLNEEASEKIIYSIWNLETEYSLFMKELSTPCNYI